MGPGSRIKSTKNLAWIWYLLPGLLTYLAFMALPLINSLRLSLYSGSGFTLNNFVGFDNYLRLFVEGETSNRFWNAFGNTWVFFLIHMLFQNSLGLIFALILSSKRLGNSSRRFFQTVIFLPTTLAIVVTGFLWKLLLNPQFGVVNLALENLGLGEFAKPWLGDPKSALIVVSLVSSWQWVGIPMMIFLAGLQSQSEELFEAAAIDGASETSIFFKIKLPLLAPIIGVVAILTFTGNFNAFDVVYAMTGANGPPNYATDILGTYFYRVGIAGEHPIGIPDMGLGAAVASVIFLVLFVGVMIMRSLSGERNGAKK